MRSYQQRDPYGSRDSYRRRYESGCVELAGTTPKRAAKWTQERVSFMREHWSRGVSARRIALELGILRSNVAWMLRKLGLKREGRRARGAPRQGRPQTSRGGALRRSSRGLTRRARARRIVEDRIPDHLWIFPVFASGGRVPAWVRDAKPYVEDPQAGAHVPPAQRRLVLDLDRAACRWPFGDPVGAAFFFCGAPALGSKAYCAEHWARAHVKPEFGPGERVAAASVGLRSSTGETR